MVNGDLMFSAAMQSALSKLNVSSNNRQFDAMRCFHFRLIVLVLCRCAVLCDAVCGCCAMTISNWRLWEFERSSHWVPDFDLLPADVCMLLLLLLLLLLLS